MGLFKDLLGIKEDKDISKEEQEAATKRTLERAKKAAPGLLNRSPVFQDFDEEKQKDKTLERSKK